MRRSTYLSTLSLLIMAQSFQDGLARGKFYLTEVMPSGLEFPSNYTALPSTGPEMVTLIESAQITLVFTSLYFSLLDRSKNGSALYNDTAGRLVYTALQEAAKRGVKIFLITSPKSEQFPSPDVEELQQQFSSQVVVHYVDMKEISKYKHGIFHTKMIIADEMSFYVGSSNADYRALSEIVEIGVFGWENYQVAQYLTKIAAEYCPSVLEMPEPGYSFSFLRLNFGQFFNSPVPEKVVLNPDTKLSGYISVSPDEFQKRPFEQDMDALLSVINSAKKSLVIAVMDYVSGSFYFKSPLYWDMIDRAIRKAAFERKVQVRIITNLTEKVFNMKWHHMKSLGVFGHIHAKSLLLPKTGEPEPPYSRLWHAKFAVSDTEAWISTNNITPDYFLTTAGIAFHVCEGSTQSDELRHQLLSLFDKYWHSNYTREI